jgi:hypothetical protein
MTTNHSMGVEMNVTEPQSRICLSPSEGDYQIKPNFLRNF